MGKPVKIAIDVKPEGKLYTYTFFLILHSSLKIDDRQIEPEYYKGYNKIDDDQPHYEIEVADPIPWPKTLPIRIYKSKKTNGRFVHWPVAVPTISVAMHLVCVFCVGTAYAAENSGNDYKGFLGGDPTDSKVANTFLEKMKSEFRIEIPKGATRVWQ